MSPSRSLWRMMESPSSKLTVKVRAQIVADGLTMEDYDVTNVGRHLNAAEWNALIGVGRGYCCGHAQLLRVGNWSF